MPADVSSDAAAQVLALARAGETARAIDAGERLIAGGLRDSGLAMFVGVLCCRLGDLERGLGHLRSAADIMPDALAPRIELARALVAAGHYGEARAVAERGASLGGEAGRELLRIQAVALLSNGSPAEASNLYASLTAADAGDFESWHGLGAAMLATGDPGAAITALRQATRLRPSAAGYWKTLARALTARESHDEAVAAARRATALMPDDADALTALGRALAGQKACGEALDMLARAGRLATQNAMLITEIADGEILCKEFARAEASYRRALALAPSNAHAVAGLGRLLDRMNRTDELGVLLAEAATRGVPAAGLTLLRAKVLRAAGDLEGALRAAEDAPEDVETAKRWQLIGDISDRVGDSDTAFRAFSNANAALAVNTAKAGGADRFEASIRRLTTLLTPAWVAGWSRARPGDDRRAPLFVFGFPRSGTTLIDTMLIGHPDTVVLEEEGVIQRITERMRGAEQIRDFTAADVASYRRIYFADVDRIAPEAPGRMIVDKEPLGLSGTPLLHRIFPDARFVFAQRHPCDVVLSCFIIGSQLNLELGHFDDLVRTAQLYDAVLTYWERCRETLPIAVHTVRYEQLVTDTETELRRLAEFAGLSWDERLVDHRRNAAERTFIGSPSYAQVAEPIYTRASGRWRRYRRQMEPVLPILAPWVEKMGYSLG